MKELATVIKNNTIFLNVVAQDQQEALSFLAQQLTEQKLVKPSFEKAIILREKEFPTGLQTREGGIAIPHTDPIHVILKAVAIAVLQQPIHFQMMGQPDQSVEVDILFMLAMKEAHSQIDLLQELATLFQQQGLLQQIRQASSANDLMQIIQNA